MVCIVSDIRGNTDLIDGTEGRFLCESTDYKDFAEKINILANNKRLRENAGKSNLATIQKFSTDTVANEIKKIYSGVLGVNENEDIALATKQ